MTQQNGAWNSTWLHILWRVSFLQWSWNHRTILVRRLLSAEACLFFSIEIACETFSWTKKSQSENFHFSSPNSYAFCLKTCVLSYNEFIESLQMFLRCRWNRHKCWSPFSQKVFTNYIWYWSQLIWRFFYGKIQFQKYSFLNHYTLDTCHRIFSWKDSK